MTWKKLYKLSQADSLLLQWDKHNTHLIGLLRRSKTNAHVKTYLSQYSGPVSNSDYRLFHSIWYLPSPCDRGRKRCYQVVLQLRKPRVREMEGIQASHLESDRTCAWTPVPLTSVPGLLPPRYTPFYIKNVSFLLVFIF